MIRNWINEINTTSLRIIASILGAIINITAVTAAILIWRWEPSQMQMHILLGEASVLLTMMGFDVIQFVGKRFTNTDYTAAKNPPTQVIAHPPSKVEVQGDAVVTNPASETSEGTGS